MYSPLRDEAGRLAALQRADILDSSPEEPFENIVRLVKAILGVPIVAVSLVDSDRQWFKASLGLGYGKTPRSMSFCSVAIQDSAPLIVPDATADSRFRDNPLVTSDPHIRSYAGIPLKLEGAFQVGSLCAIDRVPREFTAGEIAVLENFASLVVQEIELRNLAHRDTLTGAMSRRAFHEAVEREVSRCGRYTHESCLIVFDIDRFKRINDTWGHKVGDEVLSAIGKIVAAETRDADVFGRLGGEEFGILMPELPRLTAWIAAERFRKAIEGRKIPTSAGDLQVTASFGVASQCDGAPPAVDWIAAADKALYMAKHGGRNRCELAQSAGATSPAPEAEAAPAGPPQALPPARGKRREERIVIDIDAEAVVGRQLEHIVVYDISSGGYRAEAAKDLDVEVGTKVSVQIPEAGLVEGEVAWRNGHYFGVKFSRALDGELVHSLGLKFGHRHAA